MDKNIVITAIVAHAALWHNNKHYPVGAEIELTEAEFQGLAYYLTRKETQTSGEMSDDTPDNVADDTRQDVAGAEEESTLQTAATEKKAKGKKAE